LVSDKVEKFLKPIYIYMYHMNCKGSVSVTFFNLLLHIFSDVLIRYWVCALCFSYTILVEGDHVYTHKKGCLSS
jgi:hypothetical protein